MTRGSWLRSARRWLGAGYPHGVERPDHLAVALLRHELTDAEVARIVDALVLRTGHSVGDPVPDEDIARLIETEVYAPADEDDIYRVREAMSRSGRKMALHG